VLLQQLVVLYSTHAVVECLNLGIVLVVSLTGLHAMVLSSREQYTANLYVEVVWLLAPTVVVVLLIARGIVMQCSDEELLTAM